MVAGSNPVRPIKSSSHMAKKTTTKKPAKKTSKKATKKTVKKAAKKPAKKTVKKAVKKPAKKAARKEPEEPPFDPTVHILVPKHEVMSEAEIEELYSNFRVQPTDLPTIYISDPALKGLNVKMGDIIRITRESPTAKTSLFYRRVAYE